MITRVSLFVCLLCVALVKAKSNRIIGGDKATPGQFKYQVSVQTNYVHLCGGAIIGDQHILTAAHCVINVKQGTFKQMNFQVVAGSTNLLSDEGVKIEVEKIYVPARTMAEKDMKNDIAVLKLQTKLGLSCNPNLQKLDLPSSKDLSHLGDTLAIAGYGVNYVEVRQNPTTNTLEEFNVQLDGLLRYGMVEIIANSDCVRMSSLQFGRNQSCGKTVQRRGTKRKGLGRGDDGSPLVIGNTVFGIASQFPLNGDERIFPSIYTRVSPYLGLIMKAMKDAKSTLIAVRDVHSGEGHSSSK